MHTVYCSNHVDLCLQGSGDFCMCGSQTDRNIMNIAQILVFLDDLFEVLPGICGEFDVVCLFPEGLAHLLGTALL